MPLFTLQAGPDGPIVTAFVMVSAARQRALSDLKQPVPLPHKIKGLIDTGASGTCVDPSVLTALGLTATGSVQVHTPTTGNSPVSKDQYDIGLAIPGANEMHPALRHLWPARAVAAGTAVVAQPPHVQGLARERKLDRWLRGVQV